MTELIQNKNLKLFLSFFFLSAIGFGVFFVLGSKDETKPIYGPNAQHPSECLKLLEKINASVGITESDWEAVEISEVSGMPISINNLGAQRFQEITKGRNDIQANYGPFIIEKTQKRGSEFIQETDPGLIECAKNRIILSIWQPA